MIGSCIIDGIDLATYGTFIERGGSDDFLPFPDRREPDQNDWAEHDGLEVDLTDCYFDPKKVRVNYVIVANDAMLFKQYLNSIATLHQEPGLRSVFVREFNRTFEMRFVGFPDYTHRGGLFKPGQKSGKLTAEYVMDDPLQFFTPAVIAPVSQRENLSHIKVNHFDLSEFGIVVQEVYSSALRPHSLKSMLERNIHGVDGNIIDLVDLDIKSKSAARQITIDCTMLADTLTEFYVNWNALFNNMRVTVPIELQVSQAAKRINCYYVKMTNFRKLAPFKRKVKVSFSLVLQEVTQITLLRLLATKSGLLIETDDGNLIELI